VHETLEEVVQAVGKTMVAGDLVLFSPSGTSFDFFKNYEHRGQVFEQLVQKLA
jgi:UDP-N-acetylmuramoylalanine--D-glutamate ligase